MQDNTGATTAYTQDGRRRTESVTDAGNFTVNGKRAYTYDYDTLGRLIHSSAIDDTGKIVLYTDHTYDTSDRILSQSWQIGGDAFKETYSYNSDGTLSNMVTDGEKIEFTYDSLKRLEMQATPKLKTKYSYRDISTARTTSQVAKMEYLHPATGGTVLPALSYSYDGMGNITKVQPSGETATEYTYDAQNQLTEEIMQDGTWKYIYDYDTYGNIRGIYSEGIGSGVMESYLLEYSDSSWKDRLTKVTYTSGSTERSGSLTYDSIGNPLNYYNGNKNWNFTWQYGRELATATNGTDTVSYTYDVNALKYRGYYYDVETGFYYLQSRYYDPVIGRFLNADSLLVLRPSWSDLMLT